MDSAALAHHESANLNLSDGWGVLLREAQRSPDRSRRVAVRGQLYNLPLEVLTWTAPRWLTMNRRISTCQMDGASCCAG